MSEIALQEVNRCLGCKSPRCTKACPISMPTNIVFPLLKEGKIEEAGKILFENNPLSLICAYVCPHENQCQGGCVLNAKNSPIMVSEVEKYISNFYLDVLETNHPEIDHNKKVAIIGSGPAGLTIAIKLAMKGYDITIFEAHDKIGGVLRYGIPEFRLPKEILSRYKRKLVSMGIKFRPNTFIGTTITIDDLFNDGYKAVFIGTGVWKPNNLKIKGETFGHCHYAIDYLKNPDVVSLGKKVVVIGAGNVAMDAARTAIRKGIRNITVMYRGAEQDMAALKSEIEAAKYEGIKFMLNTQPLEITENSIKYVKTKRNEEGIIEYLDEHGEIQCDSVIVAVGQGPRSNIVKSTSGIQTNKRGLVETNEVGETTREGVFSSGDVVTGAKTVVQAVVQSKKVAEAIDEYVKRKLEVSINE